MQNRFERLQVQFNEAFFLVIVCRKVLSSQDLVYNYQQASAARSRSKSTYTLDCLTLTRVGNIIPHSLLESCELFLSFLEASTVPHSVECVCRRVNESFTYEP